MDKKTLVMLAVTAFIFGGAGMGASTILKGRGDKAAPRSRHDSGKSDEAKHTVPLDDFVVNLADADPQRYLKASVALEVEGEESGEEIKAAMPQIRDAVIAIVCSEHYRELLTPSGKTALKKAIKSKINEQLGSEEVTSVYFTAFAMQ